MKNDQTVQTPQGHCIAGELFGVRPLISNFKFQF